jgi:hypothetical protein
MTSYAYFENSLPFSSLPPNSYFTQSSSIKEESESGKKNDEIKQIEINILDYWRTVLYVMIPAQCIAVLNLGFKWLRMLICHTGGLLVGVENAQRNIREDEDDGSNETFNGEKAGMEICRDLIDFLIYKCSSSQILDSYLSYSKLEEKTSHATMTISSAMLIMYLLLKLNYINAQNVKKV